MTLMPIEAAGGGAGTINRAAVGNERPADPFARPHHRSAANCARLHRPDGSVLSESIPLYLIGRDHHGFWVAREIEGQCGGRFLRRRAAVQFAKTKSQPIGCALMIVEEPLELDVENQGSRFIVPFAAATEGVARWVPQLVALLGAALAPWRRLAKRIERVFSASICGRGGSEQNICERELP